MLGYRAGIYPQTDIEQRDDVLIFSGDPLAADLEVTGPVHAEIFVATTAPSTPFNGECVRLDGAIRMAPR